MNGEVEAWLTRALRVHFYDFGRIGLYELLWTLNSSPFDLSPEESKAVAHSVAAKLIAEGAARLYRAKWASNESPSGPLSSSILDSGEAWREGECYVILDPTDPVAPA